MKSNLAAIIVLIFIFFGLSMTFQAKSFKNPVIPGFSPDPTVCRVGEDYYLSTSTFEMYPGLPIYHSRDLVNWTLIGNALNTPSQLNLEGLNHFGGLYAPTLRYHEGLFYLTCNVVGGIGNFVVTAEDPAGPWSEPYIMDDFGIDGDLFFDTDGRLYYARQDGGSDGSIVIAELDSKTFKPLEKFQKIFRNPDYIWNEGPHIYLIEGKYYLMLAAGGTGRGHTELIAVGDSVRGPFKQSPAPALSHAKRPGHPVQNTGHADMIQAHDGSWWGVYLAVRPGETNSSLGRETHLAPITWEDGWPYFGDKGHVELEFKSPAFAGEQKVQSTWEDNFDSEELGLEWLHVRNPEPDQYSLSKKKNWLALKGGAGRPQEFKPFAYAGVRQRWITAQAETLIDFEPSGKEEAGLMLRANDDNFVTLGVVARDKGRHLVVKARMAGLELSFGGTEIPQGALHLRVRTGREQLHLASSQDGKKWTTAAVMDAGFLEQADGSGFTGATYGPYATGNGKEAKTPAMFDYFKAEKLASMETLKTTMASEPELPPARDHWRIIAGGEAFTDSDGKQWEADSMYGGGTSYRADTKVEVDKDGQLYQSERWGKSFVYRFSLHPGSYRLTLRFSELYVQKAGERVFSVKVNGKTLIKNLDIIEEAGFGKPLRKTLDAIEVGAEGVLRVEFKSSMENAKVSSLEIEKQ